MSEIAKQAGVRRATVYNHFPTDLDLIDACSSHWFSQSPPPDPAPWADIQDPELRAVTAITGMYAYYDSGERMLNNVMRDAPLVTALDEILRQKWWPMIDGIIDIIVGECVGATGAKRAAGTGADELRAGIRVALNFFTWQTLKASGLPNEKAARLAAGWIRFPAPG